MSIPLKQRLLSSLLMSLLLSGLMTAWVTWLNLGLVADFVARWMHAFVMAWPAAFTIVVLLAPSVQRLAWRLLTGQPGPAGFAPAQANKP